MTEMDPKSQGLLMTGAGIDPIHTKDPGIIKQLNIIKIMLTEIIRVLVLIKKEKGRPPLVTPALIELRPLKNWKSE